MSLLMDALRKAEEEKRKAAERQEQDVRATGADSGPGVLKQESLGEELKLEPLVEQTQAAATPEARKHPLPKRVIWTSSWRPPRARQRRLPMSRIPGPPNARHIPP